MWTRCGDFSLCSFPLVQHSVVLVSSAVPDEEPPFLGFVMCVFIPSWAWYSLPEQWTEKYFIPLEIRRSAAL